MKPPRAAERTRPRTLRILQTAVIEDLRDWNDETIRLIHDWLLVHIIEADRTLAAYLRNFSAASLPFSV
jgi:hypothetical protein